MYPPGTSLKVGINQNSPSLRGRSRETSRDRRRSRRKLKQITARNMMLVCCGRIRVDTFLLAPKFARILLQFELRREVSGYHGCSEAIHRLHRLADKIHMSSDSKHFRRETSQNDIRPSGASDGTAGDFTPVQRHGKHKQSDYSASGQIAKVNTFTIWGV